MMPDPLAPARRQVHIHLQETKHTGPLWLYPGTADYVILFYGIGYYIYS